MIEMLPPTNQNFPELSDSERIRKYFDVISTSNDPAEVESVYCLADDVFSYNTPSTSSFEIGTTYLRLALAERGYEGPLASSATEVDEAIKWRRIAAITGTVRGMIQGNRSYPTTQFRTVIDMARHAIETIDPNEDPDESIAQEVSRVWINRNPQMARRRAEAYRFVGSERKYGRMLLGAYRMEVSAKIGSTIRHMIGRTD